MTARGAPAAGRWLGGCLAICAAAALWAPPVAAQVTVRGSAHAAVLRFAADRSFEAITGSAVGDAWGGGAHVGFWRLFAQFDAERYDLAGRRVFVLDGQVFDLGIPQSITITPLQWTVGYRIRPGARVGAYAGGGSGVYRLAISSPFAPRPDGAPPPGPPYSDDERETHRSLHVLGGVETPLLSWLWVGAEGQWTWVPDALGTGGVSAEFEETDLGGFTMRFKVSAGF